MVMVLVVTFLRSVENFDTKTGKIVSARDYNESTGYYQDTFYSQDTQEIEREISEYCLYNGIHCAPKDGWKILLKKGILNKKEDKICDTTVAIATPSTFILNT